MKSFIRKCTGFGITGLAILLVSQGCALEDELAPMSMEAEMTPAGVINSVERYVEGEGEAPSVLSREHGPVAEFARAYESMFRGETGSAATQFEALLTAVVPGNWGVVGLLEHAVYTGNTCVLESRLDRLEIGEADKMPYVFHLAFFTARYSDALDAFEQIDDPKDYHYAGAAMAAFRAGDGDRAERFLEVAEAMYGLTARLVATRAEIAAARSGAGAAVEILTRHIGQLPDDWELRNSYFYYAAFESGHDEDGMAQELLSLALEKSHDVRVLATAAQFALESDLHVVAGQLLDEINSRSEPPADIVAYRLLLAKIDYIEGDLYSLRLNLESAFSMAPYDYWVNWFRYLLASETSDDDVAFDALSRLRRFDPLDPSILIELVDFYRSAGDGESARVMCETMLRGERHLTDEVRLLCGQ